MTGSIVSPELRARVRGIATPIAAGFGKLGLSPNHLTLIGFGIAVLAAVAAAGQAWLVAGLLILVGGVFDLFDGALARATGQASRTGAFMDSVFDRAGEAIVYVGIAAGCLSADFSAGAILAAAAMAGSFMVSYVRAKAEGLGFSAGSGMAAIGFAPREVRLVILAAGLVLVGLTGGVVYVESGILFLTDGWFGGRPILAFALALITVLATVTTIQRIVHVLRQPSEEEHQ